MKSIRIATWNVNSVRKRLGLLARLVTETDPDVVCLQEIKCVDDQFPVNDVKAMGFDHIEISGQKGYHGVAVLSRLPLANRQVHDLTGSGDRRHIGVEVETHGGRAPLLLHNFYVPSGGEKPDPDKNLKFREKLAYMEAMATWSRKLRRRRGARAMVLGDLNVAPLEHDVWSHEKMLDVVSHTPVEVALFEKIRESGGFEDVMRRFTPAREKLFTWWSYRSRDWRVSNYGRRLDHIWVSKALASEVTALQVLTQARGWPEPSDHIPVLIDLEA